MNNLSSCCGLTDSRMSASDTDFPVHFLHLFYLFSKQSATPSTKLFNHDWKTKRSGVQDKQICTTKNLKTYRKRKGKLLPLPVRALTSIGHLPMLTIVLQVLGLNWVDSNLAEAQGKYSLCWYFLRTIS